MISRASPERERVTYVAPLRRVTLGAMITTAFIVAINLSSGDRDRGFVSPVFDTQVQAYLFGYGSLMHPDSRAHTSSEIGNAYPARAFGLQRGWNCRTETTTVLGVEPARSQYINGVLLEVSNDALQLFDIREKYYTRSLLSYADIELLPSLNNELLKVNKDLPIFVYVLDPERRAWRPTIENPISQTYVDVCLSAAMRISSQLSKPIDFLGEFMNTTAFWVLPANDRRNPLRSSYLANLVSDFERVRVDQALIEHKHVLKY